MTRDTRLDGDPASVDALAGWIRSTLAANSAALADVVTRVRAGSSAAWASEAGRAYVAELAHLVGAADETALVAEQVARELEALAAGLRASQLLMETARGAARAGGLRVVGTLIDPPETGVVGPPFLPVQDAAERTWRRAVDLADQADAQWAEAVATFRPVGARVVELHAMLLTIFVGLSELPAHLGVRAWERAGLRVWEHSRQHWGAITDGMLDEGRGLRGVGADELAHARDMLRDTEYGVADAEARATLGASPLTSKVRLGFGALNLLAAGYGTYDDLQRGESVEQAVVSNGGGVLGSVVGGAVGGVGVGWWLGPPGALVGGIVGGVAGGVGSSLVIDHAYDSQREREQEAELRTGAAS